MAGIFDLLTSYKLYKKFLLTPFPHTPSMSCTQTSQTSSVALLRNQFMGCHDENRLVSVLAAFGYEDQCLHRTLKMTLERNNVRQKEVQQPTTSQHCCRRQRAPGDFVTATAQPTCSIGLYRLGRWAKYKSAGGSASAMTGLAGPPGQKQCQLMSRNK